MYHAVIVARFKEGIVKYQFQYGGTSHHKYYKFAKGTEEVQYL